MPKPARTRLAKMHKIDFFEAGAGAVGRTFLQLKLVLDAPGGGLERIYLELSLDQFYAFLAHMERAKAALVNVAQPA